MNNKYFASLRAPVKYSLITAVAGASFALPAHAGFISTVPTGFTPVKFVTTQANDYTVDLDNNGTGDYGIRSAGMGGMLMIQGLSPLNTIDTAGLFVMGYADLSSPSTATKVESVAMLGNATLSTQTPYARMQFIGENGVLTRGYIKGEAETFTDNASTQLSFTLLDFGYDAAGQVIDPTDVPEPGSLALLAAGAVGIGALRRRKTSAR